MGIIKALHTKDARMRQLKANLARLEAADADRVNPSRVESAGYIKMESAFLNGLVILNGVSCLRTSGVQVDNDLFGDLWRRYDALDMLRLTWRGRLSR